MYKIWFLALGLSPLRTEKPFQLERGKKAEIHVLITTK